MDQAHSQRYEFGPFRLDAHERLLTREGASVSLTPKAFDLLLALVKRPGRLVEKEELFQAVWPDTIVEESNLSSNIALIRKALGDGTNGERYIETVPKRGYRFVAKVKSQNDVAAGPVAQEPATPVSTGDAQPITSDVKSAASRSNRSVIILSALAFLLPVFIGVGLWQYFRLEKRAKVTELEFKGNFYLLKWKEDEVRKGIEYYNKAVILDPNSASAYEGLATAWTFLSDLHMSPREAMPKAKAAAVNALEQDETSASTHATLGLIKAQYDWDWVGAEQELKRALTLDPEYEPAHRLYGFHLIAVGRFDEAQAEMKRSLESDPLNNWGMWGLGDSFYFARQYEQAIEQYRRAIGVESKLHWTRLMLGCVYEQQGKFTEAIAEFNQARLINDNPQVLASLGHAYALSGQRLETQKVLAELQDTARRKYVSPYDLATIYAGLGEREQALAWLEKAYEERSGWLWLWLKVDPKFDGLRADERFRKLLQRIGHTP